MISDSNRCIIAIHYFLGSAIEEGAPEVENEMRGEELVMRNLVGRIQSLDWTGGLYGPWS